jgi:ubiquinone/menaquinone biosynthesis C-methylase UbiE
VDLGCGFGKSTFPLKIRFPDAEVIGIDLAGPLLKMAWKRAQRAGLEVKLRQADCRCTGLDSASIDLVTATMLIHELPVCAIEETLAEAARVLRSGGLLRLLDFHATGDPVRDLAMMEHSQRNNEPFLADLFRTDVVDLCKRVGFADACWVAFDERQVGRLNQLVWPKRREWHFPWAVLEARLP